MLWLAVSIALSAAAAQEEMIEMNTDRPDFTFGTSVLPLGVTHLEGGFTYSDERGMHVLSGPELVLRFGMAENVEMLVGFPDYQIMRNGISEEGFGDSFVGLRMALPKQGDIEFALLPGVSIPTGKRGFTSDRFDPELALAWAGPTMGPAQFAGSFLVAQETEDGESSTVYGATLAYYLELDEKTGAFLEYAGQFEKDSGPAHLLHAGLTYRLGARTVGDVHVGYGLNKNAPRAFIGAGLSYRF